MLNVLLSNKDGDACVALEGRLDTVTAHELNEKLEDFIAQFKHLTLDFKKLEYVSSAGLRALLALQTIMDKQGDMKLINVQQPVMDVFEITGFLRVVTIE